MYRASVWINTSKFRRLSLAPYIWIFSLRTLLSEKLLGCRVLRNSRKDHNSDNSVVSLLMSLYRVKSVQRPLQSMKLQDELKQYKRCF